MTNNLEFELIPISCVYITKIRFRVNRDHIVWFKGDAISSPKKKINYGINTTSLQFGLCNACQERIDANPVYFMDQEPGKAQTGMAGNNHYRSWMCSYSDDFVCYNTFRQQHGFLEYGHCRDGNVTDNKLSGITDEDHNTGFLF